MDDQRFDALSRAIGRRHVTRFTAGGLATEKFGAQGGMPSDEDVRRAM